MQARQSGPGLTHQTAQDGFHLVGIKTKFAVEMACADVFVRVAFDAGGEAQHQPNGVAFLGNES